MTNESVRNAKRTQTRAIGSIPSFVYSELLRAEQEAAFPRVLLLSGCAHGPTHFAERGASRKHGSLSVPSARRALCFVRCPRISDVKDTVPVFAPEAHGASRLVPINSKLNPACTALLGVLLNGVVSTGA